MGMGIGRVDIDCLSQHLNGLMNLSSVKEMLCIVVEYFGTTRACQVALIVHGCFLLEDVDVTAGPTNKGREDDYPTTIKPPDAVRRMASLI